MGLIKIRMSEFLIFKKQVGQQIILLKILSFHQQNIACQWLAMLEKTAAVDLSALNSTCL